MRDGGLQCWFACWWSMETVHDAAACLAGFGLGIFFLAVGGVLTSLVINISEARRLNKGAPPIKRN